MNTKNTASQPNVASIGDDAQFKELLAEMINAENCESETVAYAVFKKLSSYVDSFYEPSDRVTIPKNLAEAELMQKIGFAWLQQHAPERLIDSKLHAPADQAASVAPGVEFNAERMAHLINRLSVANRRDGHTGAPEYGNADRERAKNAVDVAERNLLNYVQSLAAPQQSLAPAADANLRNLISNAIYGYGAMLEDHVGTVDAIARALPVAAEGQVSAAAPDDNDRTRALQYKREADALWKRVHATESELALIRASEGQAQTSAVKLLEELRYLDDNFEVAPVDELYEEFILFTERVTKFLDAAQSADKPAGGNHG